MTIGLISNTHGLLLREALGPVHAVRGDNDRGRWADEVPPRLLDPQVSSLRADFLLLTRGGFILK